MTRSLKSVAVPQTELSEREQHLLKVLVQRYIEEGEPIGSRALSKDSGLDLSPATVRNVMADLEDMGLVTAPHTSAGRIPTVSGYRLFVDSLLTIKPFGHSEVERIRRQLGSFGDPQRLMSQASGLLSDVSHMAGVVTLPRPGQVSLRQIEFLPLSDRRVLVILVVNEKEVQNRIICTERDYAPDELQRFSNFLNARFAGKDIQSLRGSIVSEMEADRDHMDQMMRDAMAIAREALAEEDSTEDYVIAGETNLMGFADLSDMGRMRELFEAFNQKREILNLLDHCLSAKGVQIFIGEESGYQELQQCSLVSAPYTVDNRVIGVLGVIGPTRMNYERVIPLVDVTARLLGAALNSKG